MTFEELAHFRRTFGVMSEVGSVIATTCMDSFAAVTDSSVIFWLMSDLGTDGLDQSECCCQTNLGRSLWLHATV